MSHATVSDLRAAVEAAVAALADGEGPSSEPTLERPKQAEHGDYATNAALLLAPVLKAPPRDVAERLGLELEQRLGAALERVEVAGPGFLNLFLSDAWHAEALDAILAAGDGYGGGFAQPALRVLVEFVSANPTGPLTAASGRHAAYGDALARILEFAGHTVSREYYFNDAGGQVRRLGESIQARARGEEPPEDGYQGDYVADLAAQLPEAASGDVDAIAARGVEVLMAGIRSTLEAYRVHFDTWFSERALHEGAIERALAQLEAEGHTYRKDDALWLRSSALGDDKDRVLVKSSGEPTYLAADVAYHADKLGRGFELLVDVLGADHHGYVARMRTVMAALGAEPWQFEAPILQFVHVVERGERASMSKRRGDFVTLEELIGEIGVDATRFFMLQRSHDSTVDLDLDLAREQSAENPVYYVQYAHARIASVFRKAGGERVGEALGARNGSPPALELEEAERLLVKKLLGFGEEVAEAAGRRAPHRIAVYALELAQVFTAFYRDCLVVGVEPREREDLRLRLCHATQHTLARSLGLLGVSAPEEM
ncbi:MAG TPA: arginine--tRNA ligase [Solirubrobacteraceae bacterium]|nr:arginine--tRNA ligase [Solirubrobacteraceae bacterium]